jgi:hypothetical protein
MDCRSGFPALHAGSIRVTIHPHMQESKSLPKINVIWELLPNADSQAIHKAFLILFRHADNPQAGPNSAETRVESDNLDRSH